jgi:hypothetical protein
MTSNRLEMISLDNRDGSRKSRLNTESLKLNGSPTRKMMEPLQMRINQESTSSTVK